MAIKRLEAIVHGYVQGVGFRWWVREHARRLGLKGYVRNRADRTVEVVAEGEEEALQRLLVLLHEGPPSADVQRVEQNWTAAKGTPGSFEVRF